MRVAPWTRVLIVWTKAIASRFVGSSDPCSDNKQFEQFARNQNLSVPEHNCPDTHTLQTLRKERLEPGRREPVSIFPLCC
jgi:hypothetical protein